MIGLPVRPPGSAIPFPHSTTPPLHVKNVIPWLSPGLPRKLLFSLFRNERPPPLDCIYNGGLPLSGLPPTDPLVPHSLQIRQSFTDTEREPFRLPFVGFFGTNLLETSKHFASRKIPHGETMLVLFRFGLGLVRLRFPTHFFVFFQYTSVSPSVLIASGCFFVRCRSAGRAGPTFCPSKWDFFPRRWDLVTLVCLLPFLILLCCLFSTFSESGVLQVTHP